MTNSAMLVCSFSLKKKFGRNETDFFSLNQSLVSNDETETFDDFFDLLECFVEEKSIFSDDEKLRKMFLVDPESKKSFDTDTYRAVAFTVKSGAYGIESDMTNRHTMEVSYHRTADEADVKAFRFIVYIPKDTEDVSVNKGIFVFQSIATFGIKTITVDNMKGFFSPKGITLETRSVSVETFLRKLIEQGALNKITFIKNRISPNPSDNILISTGREEKSYYKPRLHQEWLDKILNVFKNADRNGVVEIPDDEDFDDLSIQFKLGKSSRTVRLKNLDRLSIVEDIPENIMARNEDAVINHMVGTADAYKQNIVFNV